MTRLYLFVVVIAPLRPIILVLLLYSYWIPQIAHNAWYGTRRPYFPHFAACTTAMRVFFPLYILGCPETFVALMGDREGSAVSPAACVVLVVWGVAQVVVLHLQVVPACLSVCLSVCPITTIRCSNIIIGRNLRDEFGI